MARIRFILVGRLARLHDVAGRPDLDLHVQRHVRDHPPGRHPRRGAAGMGRIPAPRWPPVPCAHRRPAAARRPAEPAHGGTRPCSRGPGPVCDGRGLRRVRPWPALGPERGRSHRCRRHRRSVCGAQAVPGPQHYHTIRRLGRHTDLVAVRGARLGLLHPNARTRSHSGTGRIPVGPPGSKPGPRCGWRRSCPA